MPKVTRPSVLKVSDYMKQKKLEQKRILKEKEAAIQAAKDLEFDQFVRKTAREMIKGTKKPQLKVFNADVSPKVSFYPSETSVWAPWSSLFRK